MGLILKSLVLSVISLAFGHRLGTPIKGLRHSHPMIKADTPLNITLISVGDRFAIFNITGSDTVKGLPVTQFYVNYTTEGPTPQVSAQVISSSNQNGVMQHMIKVVGLSPGKHYTMMICAENIKKELSPPSNIVRLLLLPPTPDITVLHPTTNTLKVIWAEKSKNNEDYFLLTIEKKSALGCGATINLTACFGNSYTLDDLKLGEVYRLTMRAHNPSGFSDPVVVSYPIE